MKKFIKGRWFPLTVAIIVVVMISIVLGCLGWRITYPKEFENSWDAISAVAAWIGAIGTIWVLCYNHKAIKLTQRSVQQAIDLQLFEKRLELYNAITDKRAFSAVSLSVKIAYTEEIYQLYSDIVELCEKRWAEIWEFAQCFHYIELENYEHENICQELYESYSQKIENQIRKRKNGTFTQTNNNQLISLEEHKATVDSLQKEICDKYALLEQQMKMILEQSINL